MTTPTTVEPVKGTIWVHSRYKTWDKQPLVLTVTSVRRQPVHGGGTRVLVYSRDQHHNMVRTPLLVFEQACMEIVSVPEQTSRRSVRLSESECALLFEAADAEGERAAAACTPTPMVVEQHASSFDDDSTVRQRWIVPEGVCGFAWVTVRPGNSSFARWLKQYKRARPSYQGGGTVLWIGQYGQSMERKEAYAQAFATVVRAKRINCYAESRMD